MRFALIPQVGAEARQRRGRFAVAVPEPVFSDREGFPVEFLGRQVVLQPFEIFGLRLFAPQPVEVGTLAVVFGSPVVSQVPAAFSKPVMDEHPHAELLEGELLFLGTLGRACSRHWRASAHRSSATWMAAAPMSWEYVLPDFRQYS